MPGPLQVLMPPHPVPYREALSVQHSLHAARRTGTVPDTVILLEHPPVITLGRRGRDSDILATPEQLTREGADVVRIERGGEVTYHGPGQLVGYFIVDLAEHQRQVRRFVWRMEEVILQGLQRWFGIPATRDAEHPGVWVGPAKIAAVGIAIKERVTFHGFAWNICPDLSHFNWIVPCGIRDRGQTSVAELTGTVPDLDPLRRLSAELIAELYDYREWAVGDWPGDISAI